MQTDRIVFPPASAHPDILLAHSGLPAEMLDWLRQYFLAAVAAGNRIAPGEHIQVGWMLVEARSDLQRYGCLWYEKWTLGRMIQWRLAQLRAYQLGQEMPQAPADVEAFMSEEV